MLERQTLLDNINMIINLETKEVSLCGRDACSNLIMNIEQYCKEHTIPFTENQFGRFIYGMLEVDAIINFANEYLIKQ